MVRIHMDVFHDSERLDRDFRQKCCIFSYGIFSVTLSHYVVYLLSQRGL